MHGLAVFIFYRNLRFAVRTEIGQDPFFADLCQPTGQFMCQRDRQGHIFLRFVRCVPEHQPLVAGADSVEFVFISFFRFFRFVYAHGDVRRLFVERDKHAAGVAVKAVFSARIPDVPYSFTDDMGNIDITFCGNFPYYVDKPRRHKRFAGNAGAVILGQNGVQDTVRNLIGHFIGMPLRNRFGCKKFTIFCHLL